MEYSGIIVESVAVPRQGSMSAALHIVSLICACVSNTITHYCTVDFHISHGLRYAHKDVCMGQAHSHRQAGRSLCLNMQLFIGCFSLH